MQETINYSKLISLQNGNWEFVYDTLFTNAGVNYGIDEVGVPFAFMTNNNMKIVIAVDENLIAVTLTVDEKKYHDIDILDNCKEFLEVYLGILMDIEHYNDNIKLNTID
jgi:hypothetical protein